MRAQHYSAKRAQLRAAWRLEGEPADVDVASARAGRSLTSGCGVKRVSSSAVGDPNIMYGETDSRIRLLSYRCTGAQKIKRIKDG